MSVTGADGIPQRVSTALSDVAAGTVAAFAIAAALVRQQRTGEGEVVDVSLLEADLAFMSPRIASFLAGDPEPEPCAGTDSVVAIYQSMRTSDRPIVVAIGNDDTGVGPAQRWDWTTSPNGEELSHQRRPSRPPRRGRRRVPGAAGDDASDARPQAAPGRRRALCARSTPCPRWWPIRRSSQRQAIVEYEHPVAGVFRGVGAPWRLASDRADRERSAPGTAARGARAARSSPRSDWTTRQIDQLTEGRVVWTP